MIKKKIIIIHSKVSFGFVGMNTTALVLQLGGYEVISIPTVLYSNHLGYATVGGGVVSDDLLTDIVSGILKLDILDDVVAIVTGYIGSENQVKIIADFIRQIKQKHPHLTYLCDPVMGDTDKGLYVTPGVSSGIISELLPLADIATPNLFEIQKIIGCKFSNMENAMPMIAQKLCLDSQKIIITGSILNDTLAGTLENYMIENGTVQRIRNRVIDLHPPGTGELFAAHVLLYLLNHLSLHQSVILAGDILSKVLQDMYNNGIKEFESSDIIASMNILHYPASELQGYENYS